MTRILSFNKELWISALIIFFALFAGFFIVVHAQEDELERGRLSGLEFPIAELGNCADKQECKTYCDRAENIDSCIEFAKKHGLMGKETSERAKRMSAALRSGETPGGCGSHSSCETYCSNTEHMEECIEFAERHGMMSPEEVSRAKQMARLMRNGETPGSCASRQACEAYCENEENIDECMEFAEKAGLASKTELDTARKVLREGGPGGCRSRQECEAFCNVPENMETCMEFARTNGFIPADKIEHMREGMSRVRMGLEQAPPEVAECLKKTAGPNIIEDIKNGTLVPGPEIGERIRACFENFEAHVQIQSHSKFGEASAEVKACLSENIDKDALLRLRNGEAPPSPEVADRIRECFENANGFREEIREETRGDREDHTRIPDDVRRCLAARIGEDAVSRLESGNIPEDPERFKTAMRVCSQELIDMREADAQEVRDPVRGGGFEDGELSDDPIVPENSAPDVNFESGEFRSSDTSFSFSTEEIRCIRVAYGDVTAERIVRGTMDKPSDFEETMRRCIIQ